MFPRPVSSGSNLGAPGCCVGDCPGSPNFTLNRPPQVFSRSKTPNSRYCKILISKLTQILKQETTMQFLTTLRGSDPFVGPRRPKNHRAKHRRHKRRSRWTGLTFGKHKGKTLPQVICSDPSWFLWAIRDDVLFGDLAQEAALLHRRLQGIRISKAHP